MSHEWKSFMKACSRGSLHFKVLTCAASRLQFHQTIAIKASVLSWDLLEASPKQSLWHGSWCPPEEMRVRKKKPKTQSIFLHDMRSDIPSLFPYSVRLLLEDTESVLFLRRELHNHINTKTWRSLGDILNTPCHNLTLDYSQSKDKISRDVEKLHNSKQTWAKAFPAGSLLPISHSSSAVFIGTLYYFVGLYANFARSIKSNYCCYATIFIY